MNTEIFATFGPSCKDGEILKQMIEYGMTGIRLNLSHMSLADAEEYIENYNYAVDVTDTKGQILIDMQGPELRVGDMDEMLLEEGKVYSLTDNSIPVPAEIISYLDIGDKILFDDGKILCEVCDVANNIKVLRQGTLKSHKSIKVINKNIKLPCLTSRDIENIKQIKKYGVAAIMQPFVLCGNDLKYVREILDINGAKETKIFAKIENRKGISALEEIVQYADCIVIARGDLGNDMPLWELPKAQKYIENTCKKHDVPYVVVTQMLASMEHNPVPTRAEVSDVFNAVYNGAYGVMLTGETAVGKYPAQAVKYLTNTAKEAENLK